MSKTPFPVLRSDLELRQTLYLAIEISDTSWLLGFATAGHHSTRVRRCEADNVAGLLQEIDAARMRLRLPDDCRVVVSYEIGFSGFWLARDLESRNFEVVILPSTILDDTGGKRRRKTDLLDVKDLVSVLIRYDYYNEKRLFRPVSIPTEKIEDSCRIYRERIVVKREIISHRNRIRGLLRNVGEHPNWRAPADQIPEGVPKHRRLQIEREIERMHLAMKQLKDIEEEQESLIQGADECARRAQQLRLLVGIGLQGSFALVHEVFWRDFKNRRHVGSFAGLTTIPRQSGASQRDGGISKRGNGRVRSLLVELAWLWLRHQPKSAISEWYRERFRGQRPRKIGIVAVARKLVVALWLFVEHGIVPEGARLKVVTGTPA